MRSIFGSVRRLVAHCEINRRLLDVTRRKPIQSAFP
jgi:hypothetical protein